MKHIYYYYASYIATLVHLQSIDSRNDKKYPQAKKYGRNALILTVFNIIFSLCLALWIVGLTVGFACTNPGDY